MHTYTESTRRNILFAVMLASFLTPFAGSALSAALPDVGRAYGAGPDSLAWILQSFLLGCIVFMLPVGKVTEKAGCRLVFMAGMAVFVISALIAPLQTEYAGFLASRALQGLGSAMIFATNNSILSLTFPPEKRGFAMGWNISMVFLGSTLGPCVGGLANFYFGWRSIFWIFAAVGSLALAFSFVSMRDPMRLPHTGKGADWIGIVLYGLSMLLTMGGLAEISRCDWAVWAFTGGIVLAVLLVVLERRVPRLFCRRVFSPQTACSRDPLWLPSSTLPASSPSSSSCPCTCSPSSDFLRGRLGSFCSCIRCPCAFCPR